MTDNEVLKHCDICENVAMSVHSGKTMFLSVNDGCLADFALFFANGVRTLLFGPTGRRKTLLELALSLPKIIAFIKEAVVMFTACIRGREHEVKARFL